MRSDQLLTALRRTAFIGDANAYTDYTDAILYDELNDKLQSSFNDLVVKARAGYWLHDKIIQITAGQSRYRIPARSVAGGLEKVEVSNTSGPPWNKLDEVPASIEQDYRTSVGSVLPYVYTVDGDLIDLIPTPTSSANYLRLSYYIRPSRLTQSQSSTAGGSAVVAGLVTAVNATTRVFTVNALPLDYTNPASGVAVSTNSPFDFVRPDGWHELSFVGDTTSLGSITGLNITLSGIQSVSDIAVGDFMRSADQTDWPCIPDDFHRLVADVAAIKVLLEMNLSDKTDSLRENVGNDLTRFRSLLLPRVKSEPKQIGIVRRARGVSTPYWRW